MNWKEFFASLVKSIAWPVAIVFVVILLRGQLTTVIGNAEKVAYGSFEISFFRDARIIRESLRETDTEDIFSNKTREEELIKTAFVSPTKAVQQAWNDVVFSAKELLVQKISENTSKSEIPYKQIEDLLIEHNILPKNQIGVYRDLRLLRNKVVHAPQYYITSEQAIEYVSLAMSLSGYFRQIRSGSDTE